MLLSFSIPSMRPMIEAGLRQLHGEDIGIERVKRQTIRAMGPRSQKLLQHDPGGQTIPYDLHLYWKSRTPERALLGVVPAARARVQQVRVERIGKSGDIPEHVNFWRWQAMSTAPRLWTSYVGTPADTGFAIEAFADGFFSAQAFADFFVPQCGDRFDGIIFRW